MRIGWLTALAAVASAAAIAADATAVGRVPAMPEEFVAKAEEVFAAAAQVTAEQYPDADFVVVDCRNHSRYEVDGTGVSWEDEWVKVLTERGRRALSMLSTWEQLRYGDAAIQLVEIVDAQGKVRQIDFEKTLREATDNSAASANIYDPMDKNIVCAVPTLKVGEIRHARVARRTLKPRMAGAWYERNMLEVSQPLLYNLVTIDGPAKLPLKSVDLANVGTNDIRRLTDERRGERIIYRWEAKKVPQYFSEPRMPDPHTLVAAVLTSTSASWEEISKWYWSMCEGHIAKTNAVMAAKVRELVGEKTGEQAIRAIFKFVSQEVRYMGITLEDTAPGYEPHDVDLTFSRLYGVCRDKAALLTAMLRVGGFEAYPVLIHAGAKVNERVPMPNFNHAIVAVATDKGYLYMDPTNESTRELLPSYLSERSSVVARPDGDGLRLTPTPPVEENLLSVESKIRLAPDGSATVESELSFNGINDMAFRSFLEGETPEARHNAVELLIRRSAEEFEISSIEVSPRELKDTETPLKMVIRGKMPSVVRRGKTSEVLTVPYLTDAINFADRFLTPAFTLEKRRFPIRFVTTTGTREHTVIDCREALGKATALPERVEKGGEESGYTLRRIVAEKDGIVDILREELLSRLEIPAEKYQEIRTMRENAETEERGEIRFAKDADREAEVHFHRRTSIFHFSSPNAYVKTNITEVTILNENGKDRSAETQLRSNDHSKSVIVEARVEKDGQVATIAPEETNEFDADWVAAAPRYPHGSIRVTTLPKVEVGSRLIVISETVESDSPTVFSRLESFDDRDACDNRTVELWMPKEMSETFEHQLCQDDGKAWKVTSEERGDEVMIRYEIGAQDGKGKEANRPETELICPFLWLSAGSQDGFFRELHKVLGEARDDGDSARKKAREIVAGIENQEARLEAIRTWIVRNVRTVATGGFADDHPRDMVSKIDRILVEGYASIVDIANLYAVMLEEAGFEVKIVFSSGRRSALEQKLLGEYKLAKAYSTPVLVVSCREGWWPWSGRKEYIVDPEATEYAVTGTSRHERDYVLDPESGKRFELPAMEEKYRQRQETQRSFTLREQGAIDIAIEHNCYGGMVGSLRRHYREMRPEMWHRAELKAATAIARNATVTQEMLVDYEGYPLKRTMSVYAERFATMQDGVMTVKIPGAVDAYIPMLPSMKRDSPILIDRQDREDCVDVIVFPEGWTQIEYLPESWKWSLPGEEEVLAYRKVESSILENGRLKVTIRSGVEIGSERILEPHFAGYLTAVGHERNAAEPLTISVRKQEKNR